jgi:hypothetical protein
LGISTHWVPSEPKAGNAGDGTTESCVGAAVNVCAQTVDGDNTGLTLQTRPNNNNTAHTTEHVL